jgi:hypothetical protein
VVDLQLRQCVSETDAQRVADISAIPTRWAASTVCFKTAHRPLGVQRETVECIKIIMESSAQTLIKK